MANNKQKAAEAALHDQTNFLPHKQLLIVFFVLAMGFLLLFIDQIGIGQILPTVGKDLHATNTISWAGTASLIGNTTFQVLYGRLSDIFGRKQIYLSAVLLLAFGDLMCGLSKNAPMLYVFRGICGVATGGIGSLCMMIVSDIVSLEKRGKYQGILGSMVGLGNVVGPFLAAAFASTNWRGLYYLLAPGVALVAVIAWWFLPDSMPSGDFKENAKKIDWLGCLTATIGVILILIPISGGGSYFVWASPMVISMLVIGGLFLVAFLVVEWKVARLPMIPLSLFKNPPVAAMLVQNFFFGLCIYNQQYMLPLYFQNVKRFSPLKSAELMMPWTITQAFSSVNAGQYISRKKRYGEVIWIGYTLTTLGTCLCLLFNRTTPKWEIELILGVAGLGNGMIFQPSIIALQAHCTKSQRAVVISVRNLLRSFGGAVGLAVSSAIMQNVLAKELPDDVKYLSASTYAKPDYSKFSKAKGIQINDAYAAASHTVWIFIAAMAGSAFLLCSFVKDRGLTRPEEQALAEAIELPVDIEAEAEADPGTAHQATHAQSKAPSTKSETKKERTSVLG